MRDIAGAYRADQQRPGYRVQIDTDKAYSVAGRVLAFQAVTQRPEIEFILIPTFGQRDDDGRRAVTPCRGQLNDPQLPGHVHDLASLLRRQRPWCSPIFEGSIMQEKFSRRTVLTASAGLAATLAMPLIVRAQPLAGKEVRLLTWSDNTGLAVLDHIAKPGTG